MALVTLRPPPSLPKPQSPQAPVPTSMREVRFEVEGESVAGKLYEPTGRPKGQLVLVHGLLSQSIEFADAPAVLASRGWRVLALDQRGFGASGGKRGIITQERATADVLAAIAWLRKDEPTSPIALLGHSMGAVFTVRALAADPTIRAAVLAAPMKTVRAEISSIEFAGYKFLHGLSRLSARTPAGPIRVPYRNDYDHLFVDKDAAARATEHPFLQTKVDLTNVPAFLAMDVAADAKRVKQPVLVILAEHDQAVKNSSSLAVHAALGGPKELVRIDSGHSMWSDRSAAKAVALVDEWLTKHIGP